MKKILAMMMLIGLCAGVGIYLYATTALDDEEYAQGAGNGDDEPESWGDDNDLNE